MRAQLVIVALIPTLLLPACGNDQQGSEERAAPAPATPISYTETKTLTVTDSDGDALSVEVPVHWEWHEAGNEWSREWASRRVLQEPPYFIGVPPFEDTPYARVLSWGTTYRSQPEARVMAAEEEGHSAERWSEEINGYPAELVRVEYPNETVLEAFIRPVGDENLVWWLKCRADSDDAAMIAACDAMVQSAKPE